VDVEVPWVAAGKRMAVVSGGIGLIACFSASPGYGQDAAKPSRGKASALTITAKSVVSARGSALALIGRRFFVTGRLRGAQPGETVLLTLFRPGRDGERRIRVSVKARRAGATGRFVARVSVRRPGRLRITAHREATGESSPSLKLRAVDPRLRFGSRGALVEVLQRRLAALRFSVRPTGVYDGATGRAVLAYREVGRLGRSTTTDRRLVVRLLQGRGAFRARFPEHGRHVEADLSRRVLALLDGDRVVRVLHTSPGRPATPTVMGSFRFYRKHPGRNASGMLHSSFFIRGYAVHGYGFVPTYPDSHGCLRIPNADARFVFDWIRIGDRIDVYRTGPRRGRDRRGAEAPRKEKR